MFRKTYSGLTNQDYFPSLRSLGLVGSNLFMLPSKSLLYFLISLVYLFLRMARTKCTARKRVGPKGDLLSPLAPRDEGTSGVRSRSDLRAEVEELKEELDEATKEKYMDKIQITQLKHQLRRVMEEWNEAWEREDEAAIQIEELKNKVDDLVDQVLYCDERSYVGTGGDDQEDEASEVEEEAEHEEEDPEPLFFLSESDDEFIDEPTIESEEEQVVPTSEDKDDWVLVAEEVEK